jgi:hypothetical protein
MIAHLVTFTWRDDVALDDTVGLADQLGAMAAGIPEVLFYRAGPNLHLRPNGADFAVLAIVADQAGLDAYLDAPAHVEAVATGITPNLGTRQAVQLDLGDDGLPAEWLR